MTRRHWITASALAAPVLQAQDAPHKIGIIGLGSRSRAHLGALTTMPEARVTALCDLDPARMRNAKQQVGDAATYADYRELVRDRNVSLVVIVSPNYLHAEMAIAALKAGKDVLLEKPLGISYREAQAILQAAKQSGRTLAVCMQRRYMRQDVEVQQAVDRGMLGAVRLVQITEMRGDWNPQTWKYPDASGKQTSWRLLRKTAGSTELEFSIHSLAHVCMLVKSPMARVSATGGVTFYKDRDTRDLSSLWCEFSSGARLSYSFSCYAPGAGGAMFSILGDRGTLRRERGQLVYQAHGGKPETLPPANVSDDRAEVALYRDLFRDIRENRPSALGPEFAMEPMKIAFACELSIAEGRVVTARDFA
ncbi:MAG: Gfo/Idh/MocA family oxidoreductase [Bryobacterales bacterium]|nr:Gfo/Idh/MocA family oxidoreductase [Bryobacterales bacterium]